MKNVYAYLSILALVSLTSSASARLITLENKVPQAAPAQKNAPISRNRTDLVNLYDTIYECCSHLLDETLEDVHDSDPTLAKYIDSHEERIEERFDEMAANYAQDVTNAIHKNITTGALAYLAYHNELTKNQHVVAIFYADWFAPYQLMRPVLEKLAQEYDNDVVFMEINANTMHIPGINIKHIPTMIFYKDSEAVDKHIGLGIDEDTIEEIAQKIRITNPGISPEELSERVRARISEEIKRNIENIIQEHFE